MLGNPGNSRLYAYLHDSSFNSPDVDYCTLCSVGSADYGTIDQNNAPIGWGYVGQADLSNSQPMFGISVWDQDSGYYAGADAIEVVYDY